MNGNMRDAFRKAGLAGAQSSPARAQTRRGGGSGDTGHRGGGQSARHDGRQTPGANFVLRSDYAAQADEVIRQLSKSMRRYRSFTTTKIRNILAMVSEIYKDVFTEQDEVLSPQLQSRIEYLKVRLVYECGREPDVVKPFVNGAGLLELLNNIGDSKENFQKFSRYMEALVAYHRFHGGKD